MSSKTPDTPSGSSCDSHSKRFQSVTKINTVFVVDRSLAQVYYQGEIKHTVVKSKHASLSHDSKTVTE